jgi:4-hydroxy-4-methyl-2-oxoglutarate aldolase
VFFVKAMPPPLSPELIARAIQARPATLGHQRMLGFPCSAIASVANPRLIAGTAVTLALPGFDSTLLHHAVEYLRPGDVLVIDRLGDTTYACIGGGVSLALARAKIAGVIVDGCCTDPEEIAASGLSVWARGMTALTTRPSGVGGYMNVPVSLGGAVALPGDLVIADASGVVFIPATEAESAVDAALELQEEEAKAMPTIGGDIPLGKMTGASALVERNLSSDSQRL